MTAITAPYSLELASDEPSKDIVVGVVATVVATKMKIFLGANVVLTRQQTINGTLRCIYRHMMNELLKKSVANQDNIGFTDFETGTTANVVLDTDILALTDRDVAIIIGADFTPGSQSAATHMYTETFNELMNVLLENLSQN